MLQKLFLLSIAGACGTVSRYALCEFAVRVKGGPTIIGTLAVNVLGSFLVGLIYVLAQRKLHLSPDVQFILLVGFLGAFTTFSAFAPETAHMLKSSQWMLAFGNVLAHMAMGISALVAGVLIGRMI